MSGINLDDLNPEIEQVRIDSSSDGKITELRRNGEHVCYVVTPKTTGKSRIVTDELDAAYRIRRLGN